MCHHAAQIPCGLYWDAPKAEVSWLRFFPDGDVTGEFDRAFQTPQEAEEKMDSRYIGLYDGHSLCVSRFQCDGDQIHLYMEFEQPIHPQFTHVIHLELWGSIHADGSLHFHRQKIHSEPEDIGWTFHLCLPEQTGENL